jgi:hypothetical protein
MRRYEYNNLETDEIRLLELHAGDVDAELQGNLHIFRLPEFEESQYSTEIILTRDGGFTVHTAPRFQALSYTWGFDAGDRPPLKILEGEKSYQIPIRLNVDGALRRLRRDIPPDQSRMYWIDALCINQDDIPEKNTQIQKMAMIYNRADSVVVWLGEGDKESSRAMDFIDRLLKLDDFDPLTRDPGSPMEWAALMNLMQRSWFNRRWIVQEIALARHAMIYCGNQSVTWQDFSSAVALFTSRYQDLRPLFQGSTEFHNHPNYLGEVDALGAKALVDVTNNLVRKSEDGTVLERLLSLEALISTLTAFEASSPHDSIYAVLWLAHDAEPGIKENAAMSQDAVIQTPLQSPKFDPFPSSDDPDDEMTSLRLNDGVVRSSQNITYKTSLPETGSYFPTTPAKPASRMPMDNTMLRPPSEPIRSFSGRSASDRSLRKAEEHFEDDPEPIIVDYNTEVYEVCKQFLDFAITRSKSLDILCHPWAPEPPVGEPELPSWISQISGAPFDKKPGRNSYGRVRADPLVGTPGNGPRNYNASGKTKAYPSRGFIKGKTLIVTGFVLDAIHVMKSPAYEGVIPFKWLDLVGWSGPPDPVPDTFWRTLVADRGPGGQKQPPAYFPLACKWVFEKRSKRGGINTNELLMFGKCPSIATEFLYRVQSVIWGRRLIVSEGRQGSKHLLGLVPEEAEEGDLICILYGCSVPVVLRRHKRRKRRKTEGSLFPGSNRDESPKSATLQRDGSFTLPQMTSAQVEAANNGVVGETSVMTTSAARLSVPAEPMDTAFASKGVRKALRKERKTPNRTISLESQSQYSFIGECYVHGMMAGEGFKHQREHGNKLKVFHLV